MLKFYFSTCKNEIFALRINTLFALRINTLFALRINTLFALRINTLFALRINTPGYIIYSCFQPGVWVMRSKSEFKNEVSQVR
ncbi:Uncharacterized protein dnm_036440 [Desulfonema magnum]|uniref:Uncharacterized protein n=1 Tax=Desulfonema magnum TaxID=45655 RepID=A0A975GN51_9BACT|nr:Uncharacterized protein dnm_036440 [Desulfonema magnum]